MRCINYVPQTITASIIVEQDYSTSFIVLDRNSDFNYEHDSILVSIQITYLIHHLPYKTNLNWLPTTCIYIHLSIRI